MKPDLITALETAIGILKKANSPRVDGQTGAQGLEARLDVVLQELQNYQTLAVPYAAQTNAIVGIARIIQSAFSGWEDASIMITYALIHIELHGGITTYLVDPEGPPSSSSRWLWNLARGSHPGGPFTVPAANMGSPIWP